MVEEKTGTSLRLNLYSGKDCLSGITNYTMRVSLKGKIDHIVKSLRKQIQNPYTILDEAHGILEKVGISEAQPLKERPFVLSDGLGIIYETKPGNKFMAMINMGVNPPELSIYKM